MNLQKMMKQAQEIQSKISSMQEKLGDEESEGSSGGGMVVARVNGKGMALKVTIDPKLMDVSEKDMLEDLIVAAFNDAKNKIDSTISEKMSALTGSLGLPPGMKLPF